MSLLLEIPTRAPSGQAWYSRYRSIIEGKVLDYIVVWRKKQLTKEELSV